MKLKSLLCVLFFAGLMMACTDNDLPPAPQTETAIDLVLTMGAVESATKAYVGESGNKYTYATPEELIVSRMVVAIFKLENNQPTTLVDAIKVYEGSSIKKTGKEGGVTPEDKDTLAYSVKNINIGDAKGDLRIVVFANPDLISGGTGVTTDYTKMTTYDQLMAAQVLHSGHVFAPSYLMKVGEVNWNVDDKGTRVVVPMTQLTAKFLVKADLRDVDKNAGYSFIPTKVTMTKLNKKSYLLLGDETTFNTRKNDPVDYSYDYSIKHDQDANSDFAFYTYEMPELHYWDSDWGIPQLRIKLEGKFKYTDAQGEAQYTEVKTWETKDINAEADAMKAIKHNGILHGNQYTIRFNLSALGEYELEYDVLPWVEKSANFVFN